MRNYSFLKIFSAVAFLIFAGWSCWATAQSLFLTLEDGTIPIWLLLSGVIGLFVLTSYCTKLIVDSIILKYCEHRTMKFVLGMIGMAFTWLLFSMPTNTHYFMYNKIAKDAAKSELSYIRDNINIEADIRCIEVECIDEYNKIRQDYNSAMVTLKTEVEKAGDPGFGDNAERKLGDAISILYQVVSDEKKSELIENIIILSQDYNLTVKRERNNFFDRCDNILKPYIEELEEVCMRRYYVAKQDNEQRAVNANEIIDDCKQALAVIDTTENMDDILKEARRIITNAYSLSPELEANYIGYPLKRTTNVVEVWSDFFGGAFKDKNYGLGYWILLSIIIDIAAFAFFTLALREEDE